MSEDNCLGLSVIGQRHLFNLKNRHCNLDKYCVLHIQGLVGDVRAIKLLARSDYISTRRPGHYSLINRSVAWSVAAVNLNLLSVNLVRS